MKTKPYNRHETFLAALTDSDITVPTPLSREELYLAKIAGEDVTIPTAPYNRYETYLAKIAGEDVTVPTPVSRLEYYLYKACGNACDVPVPANREEVFWKRYIGSEASGSTITITDATSGEPRSIVLNIIPKQTFPEGVTEPSPDHPCPISGWTEAVVTFKDSDGVTQDTYTRDISGVGTVYGGTLDMMTGLLTSTHGYTHFNGSETWSTISSGTARQYYWRKIGDKGTLVDNTDTSSHFKHANINSTETSTMIGARVYNSTTARYLVRPDLLVLDTSAKFESWVGAQYNAGTPVQVIYLLTEPNVAMIMPGDISLLPGYNKITANCGTITLKYTPDL